MARRRPSAICNKRASRGMRGEVRMTPASIRLCVRPSLSITPKPVRSTPQSIPRTRILGERLHLRLFHVDVGVDVLNVVVLLQRAIEPQHGAGVLAFGY